jgi:hypothetical protein
VEAGEKIKNISLNKMFYIICLLLLVIFELCISISVDRSIREYELKLGKKIVPDAVNIILFNLLPILYVSFITSIIVLFISNRVYFNFIAEHPIYIIAILAVIIISSQVYIDKDLLQNIEDSYIKDQLKLNGGFIVTTSAIIIIYYIYTYIRGRSRNNVVNPYRYYYPLNIQGFARIEP